MATAISYTPGSSSINNLNGGGVGQSYNTPEQAALAYKNNIAAANPSQNTTGLFGNTQYQSGTTPLPTGVTLPSVSPTNYSPVQTSAPVITAAAALADYNNKLSTFNQLNAAVSAQTDAKSKADAQAKADQAQKALQDSEQSFKQQALDNVKNANDTKQQAIQLAQSGNTTSQTPTGTTSTGTTQSSAQTPVSQPSNQGISTDSTQSTIDQADQAFGQSLSTISGAKDQLTQQMVSSINSLTNGTFPLSGPQQALISSMQTQLQQNEASQQIANKAYAGAVSEAGFRSGGQYTPAQYAGQLANAVSYGVAKINELDATAAQTMAKVTMDFQTQDFDEVNKSYDVLMKQLDDKASSITALHNTVIQNVKDQRAYSLQLQDQVLKQQQFAETQKKDAADIRNQEISQKINEADLGLKEAQFNITYGSFINSNGTPNTSFTPSSIPGYQTLSNGMPIIDGSRLPSGVNKANVGGIPVVSAADIPVVKSWSQTSSLLNQTQAAYNTLLSAGNAATPEMKNQYAQLAQQLNNQLGELSKNSQFSSLSSLNAPTSWGHGLLGPGGGAFGNYGQNDMQTLNSIRDGLNSSMGTLVPGSQIPVFGQTFKSPDEVQSFVNQNGLSKQYQNLIQSYPNLTDEQYLNIINTGQEPKQ